MLFGERILNIEGPMVFEDIDNRIKAVIIFKSKDCDSIEGRLYHSTKSIDTNNNKK
jgi:hypothetical protein